MHLYMNISHRSTIYSVIYGYFMPHHLGRRLRSWPSASLVLWETSRTKWELRAVRDVLKVLSGAEFMVDLVDVPFQG